MGNVAIMNTKYPALSGFDKRTRDLIYTMIDAGWTGRVVRKGHWLGKAPDKTTTVNVPKKGEGIHYTRAENEFFRWLKANAVSDQTTSLIEALGEPIDPVQRQVTTEALVRSMKRDFDKFNTPETTQEETVALTSVRTVVSSKPWMARKVSGKAGGTLYESEAVMERTWSDGTTDYVCPVEGCGYAADKPRSVANHYGAGHTAKGEVPPAAQTNGYVVDPRYTEPLTSRYSPTERIIEALSIVLSDAKADGLSQRDMAVAILTWMHDRPDIEHTSRDSVPLTDAQVIDKIRHLVKVPDQTETIERLTRERDEVTARLLRLQQEIDALKGLLDGIGA